MAGDDAGQRREPLYQIIELPTGPDCSVERRVRFEGEEAEARDEYERIRQYGDVDDRAALALLDHAGRVVYACS